MYARVVCILVRNNSSECELRPGGLKQACTQLLRGVVEQQVHGVEQMQLQVLVALTLHKQPTRPVIADHAVANAT